MAEHRRLVTELITQFLERDDSSRMLPGKQDAVKTGKDKVQKRVLNDYIYNIHLKFLAESPIKISRTCFYKTRPIHIALVNFASRSVCLCSKHQNFSFLLRALKSAKINSCTNPDKFVEIYKENQESLDEMLQKIPDGEIVRFQQWKRVKLANGKERQRVVEVNLDKIDFVQLMTETFHSFKGHIDRVKEQYGAVKTMKEKLPANHVMVQMDFSENYTCSTLEEIQSAYWNSSMVTLHPAVIYYRDSGNELKHSSYVYVSEVLNHNAAMVVSIIDKLVKTVKTVVPGLEHIHFWTDSPSSQYRNKTIFDVINRFPELYGPQASWHYFESGHGKGPCDGVGGTTKRNADNAIKQGKALIQDASDFYTWATQNEKGIHYEFVSEEEYNNNKVIVDQRNSEIKPVKGSMTIHAVIGGKDGDGKIAIRSTTCACDECFSVTGIYGKETCGWEVRSISTKTLVNNTEIGDVTNHQAENEEKDDLDDKSDADLEVSVNDYVIIQYDETRYPGKILDIDKKRKTVQVNFMKECEKVKRKFKWPANEDIDWVEFDEVIKKIDPPVATSRTGRMFAFQEDVMTLLDG